MPTPSTSVRVQVFALSDVGRTREHNEDKFVVADLAAGTPIDFAKVVDSPVGERGALFMVADGMGGAAAGEVASATAVDVVLKHLHTAWTPQTTQVAEDFVATIEEATELANRTIFKYAAEHPELRGMGTTATIAGLLGDTLYLAQVGDSRAYLIRDGEPRQLTKDQSLMQKLIEAGEISEEEAHHNERRNIILQALGPEQAIRIDLTHQQLRRGDVLVLCSDGLSGLVRAEEIAQVVEGEGDPERACRRLIQMANTRGGPDNITVVAARFEGNGLAAPNDEDSVGHRAYDLPGREPTRAAVEAMLNEKSADLLQTAPPALPPAVRAERLEKTMAVRGVLAALAVILAAYTIWKLLQAF